jgi:hypothetical protein
MWLKSSRGKQSMVQASVATSKNIINANESILHNHILEINHEQMTSMLSK